MLQIFISDIVDNLVKHVFCSLAAAGSFRFVQGRQISVLPVVWIAISKSFGKRVAGDFELSYLQSVHER